MRYDYSGPYATERDARDALEAAFADGRVAEGEHPYIYVQHEAAFANVSAYVIAKDGGRVATIAFKFPRNGAGRLYAYVHWLGTEMARGWAGGYGHDKRSAAASVAAKRMFALKRAVINDLHKGPQDLPEDARAFRDALAADDGHGWDRRLREAGFEVWQAV